MNLFEDNQVPSSKLKVNKAFAEKFRIKKERELLDKNKHEEIEEEDSSSSIEDEDGDLINENITSKFISTLAKIRFQHPSIYKSEKEIFEDQDFNEPQVQVKKTKKLTYSDLQPTGNDNEDDYRPNIGRTPEEEQQNLKNAFKQAASEIKPVSAKELLKIKKKSLKEMQDENTEFSKFISNKKPKEVDMLERYWGNEEELDEKDKFLRKYIMTKGWIDRDQLSDRMQSSEEDEENMDKFEEEYNFRYEEPGAKQIITYERDQPDTFRQAPENARKRQKQAKDERRKHQKLQLEEELRQLKIAKKNEIIQKLQKIQEVGGLQGSAALVNEIQDQEFDPDRFDKQMNAIYGEDYFDQEDEYEEDLQMESGEEQEDNQKQVKEAKDQDQQDIDNVILIKQNIPILMKKNLNQEEMAAIEGEDITIWWFCDICQVGIQPGEFRWDCQICDDYTLCENCQHKHNKNHKLKKGLVPKSCQPPEEKDLKEIVKQFKYCRSCQIKMTTENEYYQSKKDVLCGDCWDKDIKPERYTYVPAEVIDVDQLIDNNPEQLKQQLPGEMKGLVDDYYNLDFEDVIAGGIKTKFQYIDVPREGFGLTNDDLLYADDSLLNRYLSIKKLAPYKEGPVHINKKAQALLNTIKASAKKNKSEIFKNREPQQLEAEKPYKKPRIQLEIEDPVENTTQAVAPKRLKSYGV